MGHYTISIMKINVSYPATGCQRLIEIEDERKMRPFYDRRMAQEVSAEPLGDEWKGYIVRICGGNDKQGFPMKQGVLTAGRVDFCLARDTSATDSEELVNVNVDQSVVASLTVNSVYSTLPSSRKVRMKFQD